LLNCFINSIVVLRLNNHFEKYPRRWKLQKGDLERDFQKNFLDLTKYNEMKQDWIKYSFITNEMFDSLLENTKYISSNDIIWKKVNKNKSEITRKFIFNISKEIY
jgi:uncharacterized protein YijF (DUF1287 family)